MTYLTTIRLEKRGKKNEQELLDNSNYNLIVILIILNILFEKYKCEYSKEFF